MTALVAEHVTSTVHRLMEWAQQEAVVGVGRSLRLAAEASTRPPWRGRNENTEDGEVA